jgi:hypothetical protein
MHIVHQLPGRLRIRILELQSDEFCRKLTALLSQDDRITDLWATPACYSLTLHYDPLKITVPEIMALLRASLKGAAACATEAQTPELPWSIQPGNKPAGEPAVTTDQAETGEVLPIQEVKEAPLNCAPEKVQADIREEVPKPKRTVRRKSTKEGDKKAANPNSEPGPARYRKSTTGSLMKGEKD